MAYQPKSYRKFVATAATATIVASALAPVASAATFTDVSDRYKEAVDYLVAQNITQGTSATQFGVSKQIKRVDAAVMLAKALELNTSTAPASGFTDVPARAEGAVNALKAAGVINGKTATKFGSDDNLTRGEVALILAKAYSLKSEVKQLKFTDVAERYEEAVIALTENGITSGKTATRFGTADSITRGEFAVFVYKVENPGAVIGELAITSVTALDAANKNLRITFNNKVTGLEASDIVITNTKSGAAFGVKEVNLAADGKSALVELFAHDDADRDNPVLEYATDYTVSVNVDGKTVTTKFVRPAFLDEDQLARVIDVDSEDRQVTIEFDANNDGTIAANEAIVLDVPTTLDFNFEEALGQVVRVWFDGEENLVKYEFDTEKVVYDAIKVTKANEIETVDEEEDFDLASNFKFFVYDEIAGLDGEEYDRTNISANNLNPGSDSDTTDRLENLVGQEFDYAKVIYNDKGDVERVYAYNFQNSPILVESTKGNYILDYDSADVDLKDYTIVKDGKQIAFGDIKKDDLVFYNEDVNNGDGLAVVYNNTVKGKIDAVYATSFRVAGKNFDYAGAQYIDENGDRDTLDKSAAEELQAGGDVTVYFNFKGDVVLAKGTEGQVAANYKAATLTSAVLPYVDSKGDGQLEIELATQAGEKLYDFAVDSLDEIILQTPSDELKFETGDKLPLNAGNTALKVSDSSAILATTLPSDLEVDEFRLVAEGATDLANFAGLPATLNAPGVTNDYYIVAYNEAGDELAVVKHIVKGASATSVEPLLEVSTDDNGKVTGLQFLDDTAATLGNKIEFDKPAYANGYRVEDSTIIVDVDATTGAYPDTDDVKFTTWKDLKAKGTDIESGAKFYIDEDGNVTHIVVNDLDAGQTTDKTALITRVDINDDDEVVGLEVLVDGERKELTAENLKGNDIVDASASDLFEGTVAVLEMNDTSGEVSKITLAENRTVVGKVTAVNVNSDEITVQLADGSSKVVELNSGAEVYDATDADGKDFSVEGLGDVDVNEYVAIGLSAANSRFADVVAIITAGDVASYDVWAPKTADVLGNGTNATETIAEGASVTYTFSESVANHAAIVTAINGLTPSQGAVTASWNAAKTVLTVTDTTDLTATVFNADVTVTVTDASANTASVKLVDVQ
ncbi:S-layer homology domain-containing protein [Peribacillus saganii]|nr:S-layer homology domain-containing protein [Peribacillus saganii]